VELLDLDSDGDSVEDAVGGQSESFVAGAGGGDLRLEQHRFAGVDSGSDDPDRLGQVVVPDELRSWTVGGE